MLAVSVIVFFYLSHAEQYEDSVSLPVLLLPIYGLCGKQGLAGFCLILAAVFFALEIRARRKTDRMEMNEPTPGTDSSRHGDEPRY